MDQLADMVVEKIGVKMQQVTHDGWIKIAQAEQLTGISRRELYRLGDQHQFIVRPEGVRLARVDVAALRRWMSRARRQ